MQRSRRFGRSSSGSHQTGLFFFYEVHAFKGVNRGFVIEDLISTGGSCIDVVESLREAGAEVLGIVSIYTYGMKKGLERLKEANVKNVSLTDFDTVIGVAAETGYIKASDVERLKAFRDNPSDESWIKG